MNQSKNKGIDWARELAEQSHEDWIFGGTSQKCLAEIPELERENYLPVGERQDIGDEKMFCASASPCNLLEAKFNFLVKNHKLTKENEDWLLANEYYTPYGIEFSDVFVAVNSGTTRTGNSLKAPLEAIRKQGLIPKKLLPQLSGWDENYDPNRITEEMKKRGLEFIARFPINYERVLESSFEVLLKQDMLDVAAFAWPEPVNGIYPRVEAQPNHAFLNIRNKYFIFDSYEESRADFEKQLAPDYDFNDFGYRVYISAENTIEKLNIIKNLADKIRDLFLRVITLQILLNSKLGRAIGAWWDWDKLGGKIRSPQWSVFRKEFEKEHSKACIICGKTKVQLHHLLSFATHPELELDKNNVVWACEGFGTANHHLWFFHLGNFQSLNLTAIEDAKIWKEKIANRPKWNGKNWIYSK